MRLKVLFRKPKSHSELSPKDWKCKKRRLAHIVTHTYNGEPIFKITEIVHSLKLIMHLTSHKYKIELLKIGCDYTHSHFIIKQNPGDDLRKEVGLIKGFTSLKIRETIPWLRRYPRFWAKGFYVTFWPANFNNKKVFQYIDEQIREQEEKQKRKFN